MHENNRNWLTCRFFHTNNMEEIFVEIKVLVIPNYGDFIQFSKYISGHIFQVVSTPTHFIGRSTKDRNYHYISIEIREFVSDTKDETSTHISKAEEQ